MRLKCLDPRTFWQTVRARHIALMSLQHTKPTSCLLCCEHPVVGTRPKTMLACPLILAAAFAEVTQNLMQYWPVAMHPQTAAPWPCSC
jgi:hypothetical protein